MKPTSSNGMFFEKRAKPKRGRFFRDLEGRDDGTFHEKSAMLGPKAPSQTMKITPTGGAMGGAGQGGAGMGANDTGMGGGMYGTGDGEKSDDTKGREADEDRLQRLLDGASKGKERPAKGGEEDDKEEKDKEKTASLVPSDWDADSGIPTGFHRPASNQPEALEPGAERFHSTDAKGPDYGVGEGLQDSLTAGRGLKMKATSGHQMGKHATPRFLGTSFAKEAYVSERAGEMGSSAKRGGKSLLNKADEGVRKVTSSAPLSIAALVGMGLLGRKLGRKGFAKLRARNAPKAPPTIADKLRALPEGVKRYFTATK